MENLRAAIEADLADGIEGEFAIAISLLSPDGVRYTERGIFSTTSKRIDPSTGETVIVETPVLTLRTSSLTRVPVAGEKWHVFVNSAHYVIGSDRAPEKSGIGFTRFYLQSLEAVE